MSSPPRSLNLQIPNSKKRPSISLNPSNSATSPTGNPSKRRKPSSATSSTHPLRQTSFPPPEQVVTGSSRRSSFSPVVDDAASAVSSSVGRGSGKGKGRRKGGADARSMTGASTTASAAGNRSGDAQRDTATLNGQGSIIDGDQDQEGQDDEDDEDDVGEGMKGEELSNQEKANIEMLLSHFDREQENRYDLAKVVRLRKETVRRLVNQTLSQSVPNPIVVTVMSFTKMLVMELVERARDVQAEWLAASAVLPTGEPNPGYIFNEPSNSNRLGPPSNKAQTISTSNNTSNNGSVKAEPTSPPTTMDIDEPVDEQKEVPKEAGWWSRTKEMDRGPLTPDHMREALRRYKKDLEGGGAGFQGMSLQGVTNEARRAGGRRLFR